MPTPAPPVKACHPTDSPPHPLTPSPADAAETSPLAALSTEGSTRSPEFFRTVARLGIQAADALEDAHQMGVVHRDIKPSNLMVEFPLPLPGRGKGAGSDLPSPSGRGAGGEGRGGDGRGGEAPRLWITDFGLARMHTPSPLGGEGRGEGASLTMTGDILGTLRYMSPEQLQAKHGVLDHRTDVYSLGLTLYELLTLQPAFPGDDRQNLIRQVMEDDPRPPRQLNKAIPTDLETIVLKATAKEPQSRYATAGALADDLRRFVEDKPIQARRPAPMERAAKWARRHRWGVATAVMAAFAALLAGSHGQRREAAQRQRAERNLQLALQAMDKVYMEYVGGHLLDLGRSSQQKKLTEEGEKVLREAMQFYQEFADSNRGEPSVVIETAKAYHRVGEIRDNLGMHQEATEAWAQAESTVLQILRTPAWQQDLKRLAQVYLLLGHVSAARRQNLQAIEYSTQAMQRDPENYEARLLRGFLYADSSMPDQAIADGTEAIRLVTSSGGKDALTISRAYNVRAIAYFRKGDYDKAIADYNEAMRLLPEGSAQSRATLYGNRGSAYSNKGDFDRAIADHDEAIQLAPKDADKYGKRGLAYARKNELDRAIADYDKAIELDPENFRAYSNRGDCWIRKGELQRAIADINEAIRIAPDFCEAYNMRALAYAWMGESDCALSDVDQAIRIDPNRAAFYINRGLYYSELGELDRAIVDLTRGIEIDPTLGIAYHNRACIYRQKGELDKALGDYDEAIRLAPRWPYAYEGRGQVYLKKGDLDRAMADFDQAIAMKGGAFCYRYRSEASARRGNIEAALADVAKAAESNPPQPQWKSNLAWCLANCEDPRLRRVDRAVELATLALKQAPKHATIWTTLGAAEYRAGHWQAAVDALQKSSELKYYRVAATGFFLAMAHWQLGQEDQARQWYDKAVEWMEKNQPEDEELRRFRAEAAELLGIENEQRE